MSLPNRIALVHDWLVTMRGGEKCFEVLCELFPNAEVFTVVHKKGALSPPIERMNIHTSFLQRMPFGVSHYQRYLPMLPNAIEQFDLKDFELVISSSHAVAKGVRPGKNAPHICYCHTPMRYIWDQYEQYFGKDRAGLVTRAAIRVLLPKLRRWDIETAQLVHRFVANSRNVQERIRRIYNRPAEVIYPPVDVGQFTPSSEEEGYYLIVSALVPYKRIDIAIEAFNALGEKLVIVGTGSEMPRFQRMASSNIEFTGWVDDTRLVRYYQGCRSLIFPGEEDFGIAPVEAMACGKPVVAFGRGGALETVVDSGDFSTGVFFHHQTAESLIEAVRQLERRSFDPLRLQAHALRFDRSVYKQRMLEFVKQSWDEWISQ